MYLRRIIKQAKIGFLSVAKCPQVGLHKKYYEKNKEKDMENGTNYLHKLKEENPDIPSNT